MKNIRIFMEPSKMVNVNLEVFKVVDGKKKNKRYFLDKREANFYKIILFSKEFYNDVEVYRKIPEGWKILDEAISPEGAKWIYNGKSHFSKEYRHALLSIV